MKKILTFIILGLGFAAASCTKADVSESKGEGMLSVDMSIASQTRAAVGEDELGAEALEQVRRLQVDTRYISSVEQQTGVCLVTLQDGTPNYNIKLGTAMDAIPFIADPTLEQVLQCDAAARKYVAEHA